MAFNELIEKRYSVRKVSDQKIDEDKIKAILRSSQVSPALCNKQPQEIYVLNTKEALSKLQKCKPLLGNFYENKITILFHKGQ